MVKNKEPYLLVLLSIAFLTGGYCIPGIPFLLFLGIAPLFRMHDIFRNEKKSFGNYFSFVLIPLILSYFLVSLLSDSSLRVFHGPFYGILMSFALFIFWLSDKYASNRLGFFTVLIYWLAMEYVAVQIFPDYAWFNLGTPMFQYPDLVGWSPDTGTMGISAWILFANILMYLVFFKEKGILEGRFRPLTLVYSLLLISIPALISVRFYENRVITEMAIEASGVLVFGRTAAWVSILLVLYSLVQRKVNKDARSR